MIERRCAQTLSADTPMMRALRVRAKRRNRHVRKIGGFRSVFDWKAGSVMSNADRQRTDR